MIATKFASTDFETLVIGGGPAGLTAARELAKLGRSSKVFESSDSVGGISRTVNANGYRFDLGGHRFFTKSRIVQQVWEEILGEELLERSRMSRIFYGGKFFDYPLKPLNALSSLGPVESAHVLLSYVQARMRPCKPERTFEDWVVNRFGRRLFEIFFKTYTEKVWGIPCDQVGAEWASQRIKNLDLMKAVKNALFSRNVKDGEVITTLIDRFLYPRLGPGQMWERCRDQLAERGIETLLESPVVAVHHEGSLIVGVDALRGRKRESFEADEFLSSMPLRTLVHQLTPSAPDEVLEAADALSYRDFLTVALIVDKENLFPDNWIYVHAPEVRLGRIQNFKNWSPDMVPDSSQTTLGLEYFVNEGDDLWTMDDDELGRLGARETARLGLIDERDVMETHVVRVRKAYPVYDRVYQQALGVIRGYLARFPNLQLIGRNGQHRYNNQDHSMLTGIYAARNIAGENHDVWAVNTETEYHEAGDGAAKSVSDDRSTPSAIAS